MWITFWKNVQLIGTLMCPVIIWDFGCDFMVRRAFTISGNLLLFSIASLLLLQYHFW